MDNSIYYTNLIKETIVKIRYFLFDGEVKRRHPALVLFHFKINYHERIHKKARKHFPHF